MSYLVGDNKKCVLCGCSTQRLFTTAWTDDKRNDFVENNSMAFASKALAVDIRFYLCSDCIMLPDYLRELDKKVGKIMKKKLKVLNAVQ